MSLVCTLFSVRPLFLFSSVLKVLKRPECLKLTRHFGFSLWAFLGIRMGQHRVKKRGAEKRVLYSLIGVKQGQNNNSTKLGKHLGVKYGEVYFLCFIFMVSLGGASKWTAEHWWKLALRDIQFSSVATRHVLTITLPVYWFLSMVRIPVDHLHLPGSTQWVLQNETKNRITWSQPGWKRYNGVQAFADQIKEASAWKTSLDFDLVTMESGGKRIWLLGLSWR